MSYSFVARGATKAETKADLARQMKHLATHQPDHVENKLVATLADAFLAALAEPKAGQSITVAVAGVIGGIVVPPVEGKAQELLIGALQVNVNAQIVGA